MSTDQTTERTAIEARQRANGCNQDNEPDDWGVPCCDRCLCASEARQHLEVRGNA